MVKDASLLDEWAHRIAREVAPHEEYQASLIVREFARGGRDRKRLFKQAKGEVGGSGLEEIHTILPYVFQGLVVAAPILYKILADGAINNGIDLLKLAREASKRHKDKAEDAQKNKNTHKDKDAPLPDLVDEAYAQLKKEIAAAPMSPEEAEQKSQKVVVLIFQNLEDAARFIKGLGEEK